MFKLFYYDPEWTTNDMADRNPLAHLVIIDGIPIDARTPPSEVQEVLRDAGFIR